MNGPARRTVLGIDALVQDPAAIAGQRVALLTNHAGVTGDGVPTWKAVFDLPQIRLVRLFGPEHGVDGGAEYMEGVSASTHRETAFPWLLSTARPRKA